eukprot:8561240-Pyramimonas_sp.AAC.2
MDFTAIAIMRAGKSASQPVRDLSSGATARGDRAPCRGLSRGLRRRPRGRGVVRARGQRPRPCRCGHCRHWPRRRPCPTPSPSWSLGLPKHQRVFEIDDDLEGIAGQLFPPPRRTAGSARVWRRSRRGHGFRRAARSFTGVAAADGEMPAARPQGPRGGDARSLAGRPATTFN